jgi:RNA polymerase sigma-70 factor (ECF subfamily)
VGSARDSATKHQASDPDARLMLRVRDDDEDAFEQLIERYQDRVVGVLTYMINNPDDAEELAQEVFLRVYRSRKGYQPTSKFSTWLFTIVNNLALNAIRDKKRRPATDVPAGDSGPLGARPLEQLATASSGSMPSRVFVKAETAEKVRLAVMQLPDDQRMAIMLNKFENMNYRQIAEIMNKSEMAIKSLLARARYALREILEPYIAGGDERRKS